VYGFHSGHIGRGLLRSSHGGSAGRRRARHRPAALRRVGKVGRQGCTAQPQTGGGRMRGARAVGGRRGARQLGGSTAVAGDRPEGLTTAA
jgi:hypothetical protein